MTNNWEKKAFQEISQRKRAYLIEINSRQFKSSSFHRFSIIRLITESKCGNVKGYLVC